MDGFEHRMVAFPAQERREQVTENLFRIHRLDIDRRQAAEFLHGVAHVFPGALADLDELQGLGVEDVNFIERAVENSAEPGQLLLGVFLFGDVAQGADKNSSAVEIHFADGKL